MDTVDCIVVGAGVVGLAAARALALQGREVIVLEAAGSIGTETSSRNSEVIHAGLYYPTGSFKASICVAGRETLYTYCQEHGVPHQRCGKLVVAADQSDMAYLERLREQAIANGVDDVRLLDRDEMVAMEPALTGTGALLSPSTGIIDSHALMLAYQGDAEAEGAMIAFNTPVIAGRVHSDGIEISTGGDDPMTLKAGTLVNAGGLAAWEVTRMIVGAPNDRIPPRFLAKGNYFTLSGRAPFSRLIYPVPEPGGLGVHLTLDMGGQARFGPDVEWVDDPEYDVDPGRADGFYAAIRRYWPGLVDGALEPGYSGIRPKVSGPGQPAGDFIIQDPAGSGAPGLITLYGIESPGLTASLAIGSMVADMAT